jgi:hypothetical protein
MGNMTIEEFRALGKSEKRNKYHAKPTTVDGIWFPSGLEANRYVELRMLERAGVIQNLRRQVSYKLSIGGIEIGSYRADFVYLENGKEIVEDTKGFKTDEYLMKRQLMLIIHGIEILETTAKETNKWKQPKKRNLNRQPKSSAPKRSK